MKVRGHECYTADGRVTDQSGGGCERVWVKVRGHECYTADGQVTDQSGNRRHNDDDAGGMPLLFSFLPGIQ